MQAFGDIAGEAQLGAGGGDIQQLSAQRRAEFFPGDFRGDRLALLDAGAVGVAALVVEHFGGKGGPVAGDAVVFAELHRALAFPGDTHAFVEGFDAKRLAVLQETFAGVGDEFVQRDHPAVAVDVHQEALEALVAIGKGDQQGVAAILQQAQVGLDFHGGLEHLRGLRPRFFDERVGHLQCSPGARMPQ